MKILEGVWGYGLLMWLYGVVTIWLHPKWVSDPFSHLTLWIRLDTATMMAFAVSFVAYILKDEDEV